MHAYNVTFEATYNNNNNNTLFGICPIRLSAGIQLGFKNERPSYTPFFNYKNASHGS